MGLFGFGKKKHQDDEAVDPEADEAKDAAAKDAEDAAEATDADGEKTTDGFSGRGETTGPWDVDDENVPDYDEYLDIGSLLLPVLPLQFDNAALRLKGDRATGAVLGAIITVGGSTLELEAYAAPKTMGLWDDVRADLRDANQAATEVDGTFGKELLLPVQLKGGTVLTRIVGVDGPRWMLRGIFAGRAAQEGAEREALDEYFTKVVVVRGEEPLAPRDMIPMHPPITPAQRRAMEQAEAEGGRDADASDGVIPGRPKGPFNSDHETETKTTLSRGPMFSEVR